MSLDGLWLNIIALVAAFLISVVITPIVRKYAIRWKLGDKPNGRKIHTWLIPHLGGIALVLGTFGAIVILRLLSDSNDAAWTLLMVKILPAVTLLVALGLVDDMMNLRAIQKLTIQVIAAVILVTSGFLLFTGVSAIDGHTTLVFGVSLVFLVGLSNAVNLIDGHDGLAAGVSLVSALGFAAMGAMLGASVLVALSLAIAGACAGFLVFNFPPGRIYMGDNGSMFLGIMLALLACSISTLAPTPMTFLAVCLILGVPILDAMLAIVRRLSLRAPLFRADAMHMHHVLSEAGFSPRQVLLVLYSLQIFLSALGLMAMRGFVVPLIVGTSVIMVAFALFLRLMLARQIPGGRIMEIPTTTIPLKSDLQNNISARRTSVGR